MEKVKEVEKIYTQWISETTADNIENELQSSNWLVRQKIENIEKDFTALITNKQHEEKD